MHSLENQIRSTNKHVLTNRSDAINNTEFPSPLGLVINIPHSPLLTTISNTIAKTTPSLLIPSKYSRIAFTHTSKCGRSYVVNTMKALRKRNNITIINGEVTDSFHPSKKKLATNFKTIMNKTIYQNYVNYIVGFKDFE